MKVSPWMLGIGLAATPWNSAMQFFDIGAMLSPYNQNGSMNTDEIQALAAFHMAIDEINADPNALPGYIVRGTFQSISNTASAVTATLALSKTAFGSGVDFTMGTLDAGNTIIAIEIFAHYVLPHMVLTNTDSAISLASSYPYHLRVVPSTAYEVASSFILAICI